MPKEAAVILSACRTPIGKLLGSLSSQTAPQLGADVIGAALRRAGVDAGAVDDVIMGNVLQAGVGQAPARQAALAAGLPPTVSALTVNKVCGSGLEAVMLAAQAVRAGEATVVVAGGMESMSRAPHLLRGVRQGWKLGDQQVVDAMLHDGLVCAFGDCHMGVHAEYTARKAEVTRPEQDAYAAESQRRAAAAIDSGAFADEVVPVSVSGNGELVTTDEGPRRDTTEAKLATLKPVFQSDGTVTAGNASLLSDGAAALVVTSAAYARKLDRKPLARIVASATAGVEPSDLFFAPIDAVRRVLEKARLNLQEIDLFEINEAFASQMLACLRGLELPHEKVNVHGGAIALGHPIGASGARVLVTLLHAMRQRDARRGLATLCLGGGNAVAMIVQREDND
ncbi:MAG: acetyl-CoA C-acetyltransferase [Phycisphaeraceae bacterium]